jgi:protease II
LKADAIPKSHQEAEEMAEVVLDIAKVPFIPHKLLRRTLIDGFKISDDHSLIAFKLDIGNTERITAGFKDMNTGKVLSTKLNNIGDIIFGCGRVVYYTVCDEDSNRPYKVVRLDVSTGESSSLFVDDDPTHYLDIGITKDKRFIVINSNTKEDSEVWVTERTESLEENLPRKLIPRVKDV